MEKSKKIKIFIGLFYLILLFMLFCIFFFQNLALQEITSYEFIKNNRDYFFESLRSSNLFLLVLFIFFIIIWVL